MLTTFEAAQRFFSENPESLVYVVESTDTGLAKVVISQVTPGLGQKKSQNSSNGVHRFYLDEPIPDVVQALREQIQAGVPCVNRLGHVQEGQHYNDNPPISDMLDIWIDTKGVVYCKDQFFLVDESITPEAFDWARRAYRGEWLPRSWEAISVCPKNKDIDPEGIGVGNCILRKVYAVAWLDPQWEDPGFSEAKVIQVVEAKSCGCGSTAHQGCKCSPNSHNSILNTIQSQESIQAGAIVSGGKSTKGDNKIMDFTPHVLMALKMGTPWQQIEKDLRSMGADDAAVNAAKDVALANMSSTAPPEMELEKENSSRSSRSYAPRRNSRSNS